MQTHEAIYKKMTVDSEDKKYRVQFDFQSGSPDDALREWDSKDFSTYDRDNDKSGAYHCAEKCGSGFWYDKCDPGNEEGTINQSPNGNCGGFSWDRPDPDIQLKETNLYLFC